MRQRPVLRLFLGSDRIPIRMIATFTHARTQSAGTGAISNATFASMSSALGALSAAARSTFLFSPLMADDRKTLIQGLRDRDPELLDRLIEEYQHRSEERRVG